MQDQTPKPFTLQSPQAVAEAYGGDKKAIANAMQQGIVDVTSGTLAGMWIDRMRSSQVQAPTSTVAQDTFQQEQPQQAQQPAVYAAGGGLMGLPVANDLTGFGGGLLGSDEEAPQSYAAGGMVSFADGGGVTQDDLSRLRQQGLGNGVYDAWKAAKDEDLVVIAQDPRQPAENRQKAAQELAERRRNNEAAKQAAQQKLQGLSHPDRTGLERFGNALKGFEEATSTPREPAVKMKYITDPEAEAALMERQAKGLPGLTDFQRDAKRANAAALRGSSAVTGAIGDAVDTVGKGIMSIPNYFMKKTDPNAPAKGNRFAVDPSVWMDGDVPTVNPDDLPPFGAQEQNQTPSTPYTAPQGGGAGGMRASASVPFGGARAPMEKTPGREELIKQEQELRAKYAPEDPYITQTKKELEDNKAKNAEQKKQDMWQSLMSIGFRTAATKSPYLMQAIGDAGAETAPEMQHMREARKASEEADKRLRLQMAQADDALKRGDLATAQKLESEARDMAFKKWKAEQDIAIAKAGLSIDAARLNKPSDAESKIENLVKAKIANGDKRSIAIIRGEATRDVMDSANGLAKYRETAGQMTYTDAVKQVKKDVLLDPGYRKAKDKELYIRQKAQALMSENNADDFAGFSAQPRG